METAFWDLQIAKHKFCIGIEKDYNEILETAKVLLKELGKCHFAQLTYFKDMNQAEISSLKLFFLNEIKNDERFRSLHDKIFKKWLLVNKTPSNITMIFEDLIKGITYFSNQVDSLKPVPIYHRLMSCGPNRNSSFRQTHLQCKLNASRPKLRKIRRQIERCYTERLIYNQLYVNEKLHFSGREVWESPMKDHPIMNDNSPTQDEGHRNWLNETKKDFHSCFPEIDIKVQLQNYVRLLPTKICICKYYKSRLVSEETYIKEANLSQFQKYLAYVDCFKKTTKSNQVKVQRFEKNGRWTTLNSPLAIPPTIIY